MIKMPKNCEKCNSEYLKVNILKQVICCLDCHADFPLENSLTYKSVICKKCGTAKMCYAKKSTQCFNCGHRWKITDKNIWHKSKHPHLEPEAIKLLKIRRAKIHGVEMRKGANYINVKKKED